MRPLACAGPCSVLVGILGSILKDLRVKYQICICASMFFAGKVVAYKVVYVLLFLSWVAWYQVDPGGTPSPQPLSHVPIPRPRSRPSYVNELGLQPARISAGKNDFAWGALPCKLPLGPPGFGRPCPVCLSDPHSAIHQELCLECRYTIAHEKDPEVLPDGRALLFHGGPYRRLHFPVSSCCWIFQGNPEERLHDVGLERFDAAELFAEILLPAALLLACILQRHYFNEDFLKTTSLYNSPIKWKGTSDRLKVILRKLQKRLTGRYSLSSVCVPWSTLPLLLRLRPGREEEAAPNFANKASSSDWKAEKSGRLGRKASALLEMVNGTQGFSWRILEIDIVKLVAPVVIWLTLQEGRLAVLVLMTLEVTVSRQQRFHRLRDGLPEPLISTTSDTVTREHLDNGPLSTLQFFVNFGFCKFGLEDPNKFHTL
ncbi:piezo-type mechanosensitive ion channel component 2-like [Megaptera novaeangliae]